MKLKIWRFKAIEKSKEMVEHDSRYIRLKEIVKALK